MYRRGGNRKELFCTAQKLEDKDQEKLCAESMQAFNTPFSIMLKEIDSNGMYDSAAEALGKVFISMELGGHGTTTAETLGIE